MTENNPPESAPIVAGNQPKRNTPDELRTENADVSGHGFGAAGDSRPPGDMEAMDRGDVTEGHMAGEHLGPLFEEADVKDARQRWRDIQAGFVDDPHMALQRADELNDEIVRSLTSALDARMRTLQEGITNADTEQLRIGLRQYHELLDHILAL